MLKGYLAFCHALRSSARWGGVKGIPWQTVTGGGGELAAGQGPAQQIGGRLQDTYWYTYHISVVTNLFVH